ncbi:unnamed protein product [Durusdinium trenchii]|uniref:Uncharacterized protein n=2 Tax=Durusdinium trenchii TaxID=1381693 RepID=A0ABP0QNJ2_9DINO
MTAGMENFNDALDAFKNASRYCWIVFGASTIFSAAAGLFIFTLQGRVSATTPGDGKLDGVFWAGQSKSV